MDPWDVEMIPEKGEERVEGKERRKGYFLSYNSTRHSYHSHHRSTFSTKHNVWHQVAWMTQY